MNKHTRSASLIDGHTEEMTDAEIIKALECCNSTEKGHCLNKCPYYNYSANCMQSMINDTLDLIKRQRAEIKQLENIERVATKLIEKQDAEIELLQKTKQLIKSEAIKEFWKRFDKVLCENIGPSKRVYWKISSDGNNLVKEMTEDGAE